MFGLHFPRLGASASASSSTSSSTASTVPPPPAGSGLEPVYYDPDADGGVAAFHGGARFRVFRQQFEEAVRRVADRAAALRADHPLIAALDTFLFEVFDDPGFEGARAEMYLLLKPALERIVACLESPSLPSGASAPVLDGLAAAVVKCSGGKINACADAAMKLQLACDASLRSHAALACYEVLQAQLQSVTSLDDRGMGGDDGPQFETHRVQAMMNALAPRFGFDAVADPLIVPLSAREQAEVDALQSPVGLAHTASLILSTLADRYLDALTGLLGSTHPLSRGERATPGEAAAAHALMEGHPALAGTFCRINPALLLQAVEDDDGECLGYALSRDTALLQWQFAQALRAQGVMADVVPDVLARWSEPACSGDGVPGRLELRRMGSLYWVADHRHEAIPRGVELADLARLSIGGHFRARDFLQLADSLLRRLPPAARSGATVPQLEHALLRLKPGDLRAAMALDALWGHIRAEPARCASAQRMLMDKTPAEQAARDCLSAAASFGLSTAAAYWQLITARHERWRDVLDNAPRCALVAAAAGGHLETLRQLIEAGAQLAPVCELAVQRAEAAGHGEAAAYLRATLASHQRLFDLLGALAWRELDQALAALPWTMSALRMRDHAGRTLLQLAIEKGGLGAVRQLVESGADIHALSRGDDGRERTPLAFALDSGALGIAGYLIEQGAAAGVRGVVEPADYVERIVALRRTSDAARLLDAMLATVAHQPYVHDHLARVAFFAAIVHNHIDLVQGLLRAHRDIVLARDGSAAALRHAVHLDDAGAAWVMTDMLIEYGCSLDGDAVPNTVRYPWAPVTVLESAVMRNNEKVVGTLLRAHPARAEEGWEAARRLGRVSLMQALLQQSWFATDEPARREQRSMTLLDAAFAAGDMSAVTFALSRLDAPEHVVETRLANSRERRVPPMERLMLAALESVVRIGFRLKDLDWNREELQVLRVMAFDRHVLAEAARRIEDEAELP